MTFTFLITAAVLIILLIIPQIMKRIVYKKLTGYLSERDYERFEKLLDGFACTFSFKPYNREYMRLNSYFMQGDKRKIEAQLDTIFSKMKMRDQKKSEYIEEIRERLEPMKKMPDAFTNDAKRVRIGIFEYLLGLQYTYLCNKKLSKAYLTSALKNCRNTPYEYEIKKLLKA